MSSGNLFAALSTGAGITTLIGLMGFIIACLFIGYLVKTKSEERKFALLDPRARAVQADRFLTRYGLQVRDLSPERKDALVHREMNLRFRRDLSFAGLGAAVFVICVFILAFRPAAFIDPIIKPPPGDAAEIARAWLQVVDTGDYGRAYDLMGNGFKARTTKEAAMSLFTRFRQPLGMIEGRQLESVSTPQETNTAMQSVTYRTKYENDPRNIYEGAVVSGEGQEWKVSGIYLALKNADGVYVPYELYVPPVGTVGAATSPEP